MPTPTPTPPPAASPTPAVTPSRPITEGRGASIADILERAASLIEPKGAWIKGASARTAPDGARVIPSDPSATCWCASGAIDRLTPDWETNQEALKAFRLVLSHKAISDWNDAPGRTQAEVVAKLREAAALAKAHGHD